jgi:hypothetical protein
MWLSSSLTAADESVFFSGRLGASFEIPEGWRIDTTEINRIDLRNDDYPGATISIIKNLIAPEQTIRSADDLETAVLGFYRDLEIREPSEDSLILSVKTNRAEFVISYMEIPMADRAPMVVNSLKGIIIRARDGRQYFYLMTCSTPDIYRAEVSTGFNHLIASFGITHPQAARLYPRNDMSPYLLILLILALTAFFYARNRRVQKSRHPLGLDSGSFWRCTACGKVNHAELNRCRRCGNVRRRVGSINSEK